MKAETFEMALDEIVWLITLLANQSVHIHNRLNEDKKELLTEDDVELLTSPAEMETFKDAIMEAIFKGKNDILNWRKLIQKTKWSSKR